MSVFVKLFEEDEEEEVRDAEWLHSLPDYRLYSVFEELGIPYPDFNKLFWQYPSTLYHATQEDYVPDIEAEGLKAMNKTRGIGNRSVGGAVFTTSDLDDLAGGSYGPVIFAISTGEMKQAGYTPVVTQEPDIETAEARSALAHRLGIEDFEPNYESDMWHNTVIIHGSVPPQFLTQLDR